MPRRRRARTGGRSELPRDSIRYPQDRQEVWTFNHTGKSITAFEPMTGKVIATIDVGGVLEEAVEDPSAHRVYVNVEEKGAIGVVDGSLLSAARALNSSSPWT